MKAKRVIVHIDRLALRGWRSEDRHAIAGALRDELERQLAAPEAVRGVLSRGDASRLRIRAVRIEPGAKTARAGTQVAKSIARGIKS